MWITIERVPRHGATGKVGLAALLLVAALAFGVYANSLPNRFAFDDCTIIQGNATVRNLEWINLWGETYWPNTDGLPDVLYRPLTICSYLFNQALAPEAIWGYHLVNVLLHVLASMMLTVLTWRLFGRRALAVGTGILFAIHPIHTEAVANVVGRAELLAAVWSLAALLVFLPEHGVWVRPEARRPWWHGPLVAACFLLALFCKETPAALLAAFVFLDVWRWMQWAKPKPALTAWLVERWSGYYQWLITALMAYLLLRANAVDRALNIGRKEWFVPIRQDDGFIVAASWTIAGLGVLTLVGMAAMHTVLRYGALVRWGSTLLQGAWHAGFWSLAVIAGLRHPELVTNLSTNVQSIHPVVNPLVTASLVERLWTPFLLIAKYVLLTFWPAKLAADYSAPSIMPVGTPLAPEVVLGLLIVLGLVVVAVGSWRRAPGLTASVVLLACSYALVANIMRIGTIFGERLFYWPSAFAFMLIAYAALHAWERLADFSWSRAARGIGVAFAGAACVALGARTCYRNPDWHDNVPLALATAASNPTSAKACFWAGMTIMYETREPWMVTFGEKLIERAVDMYPRYGQSQWELAKYYSRQGKFDLSLVYLAQAAVYRSGTLDIRVALRAVKEEIPLHAPGTYMPTLEKDLREHPTEPAPYVALGLAYMGQKEYDKAAEEFRRALALAPGLSEAAAELGLAYIESGRKLDGMRLLKQYVLLQRYNGEARCQLAQALLKLDVGEYPNAVAEARMNLERAVILLGRNQQVNSLLAQCRKRQELRETSRAAAPDAHVAQGL